MFDETCFPYLAEIMAQNQRVQTSEDNAQVEVELQVKNQRQTTEIDNQMPQEEGATQNEPAAPDQ